MNDPIIAQGVCNIVAAELSRGNWTKRRDIDDLRGEAIADCLQLLDRKDLHAPLAYIRQSVAHIIISAARRLDGEAPVENQTDEPVLDRRTEARAELDATMQRLWDHITAGEALYRELQRIRDAI